MITIVGHGNVTFGLRWMKVITRLIAVSVAGQVGSGSNAAIAVAASRAIGATLEVINLMQQENLFGFVNCNISRAVRKSR